MADRIARGISIVFHPLFFPVYVLLFFINRNPVSFFIVPLKLQLVLSTIVILSTIALPMSLVLILYKMKLIGSVTMKTRGERFFPLLIMTLFYGMTYYLLKNFSVSVLFSYYMLGSAYLAIIAMVFTFWMKISLHCIGTGGIVGMLLGISLKFYLDLTWLILPAILLCGIVGFARLQTDSHKPSEIYTGLLAGAVAISCFFCLL